MYIVHTRIKITIDDCVFFYLATGIFLCPRYSSECSLISKLCQTKRKEELKKIKYYCRDSFITFIVKFQPFIPWTFVYS
jgi:hypothetical protein